LGLAASGLAAGGSSTAARECVAGLVVCRIQARLKADAEEMAKWKWGVRAGTFSEPMRIDNMSECVLDAIEKIESQTQATNPPYVIMVHEMKGHGLRSANPRNAFSHHEGINIS
jgi:hypothetical protein